MSQRLSATDISALASMKNVAKCDTWCELQNPVNHRVFERKLRPKPSGRGHVCMGVTHRVAPLPALGARGWGGYWPPVRPGVRLAQTRSLGDSRRDQWWLITSISRLVAPRCRPKADRITTQRPRRLAPRPRPRPHVRRDYPLSLSISISGGKETYKDSPSNGERTGKSPT